MEVKVINEYRLSFLDPQHREMLQKACLDFLKLPPLRPDRMIHVEGLHQALRRARPLRGRVLARQEAGPHRPVRPNGAGKTTLLRMLAGLEEPDAGSIRMASDTTIGYLPQDGIVHHGRTVYDEVVLAFQELLALKEEQHQIEDAALPQATHDDGGDHEQLLERYAEVTDRFKHLGRLRDRRPGGRRAEGPRLHRWPTSSARPRSSPAAGRCASRWPSCCWPGRTCCSWTSPRTTSTCPRATGSRSTCTTTRARWCSSRTTATSSTPPSSASPRSACAPSPTTTATTRSTWSSTQARMERLREAHRRQSEEIEKTERLHQQVPLPGHQGAPGAEPHQDAGQGRAHRDPARAQEDPLQVPRRAQAGPRGAGAEGRAARPTATTSCSSTSTSWSSAATASRSWARTAPASPRSCASWPAWTGPTTGVRLVGHQVVIDYFAQDQAAVLNADAHGLRGDDVGQPDHHGADDPEHPGRLPVLAATTSTSAWACSPAASATAWPWPRCCSTRATSCSSTSPRTTSTSTPRKCCSRRSADYGGTLIFVSHDRYFVDKLASKVIEVGGGEALVYPGGYEDFLYWKKQREAGLVPRAAPARRRARAAPAPAPTAAGRPRGAAAGGRGRAGARDGRRRRPAAPPRRRTPAGRADARPTIRWLRGCGRRGGAARPPGARARGRASQGPRRRARAADRGEGAGGQGRRAPDGHARASTTTARPRTRRWPTGSGCSTRWPR